MRAAGALAAWLRLGGFLAMAMRVDQPPRTPTTTVIQPSRGWVKLGLKELWQYRELLYFLTWKDILIRYKQAVLGVAWAVLQPVMAMIVFTFIFGLVLGVKAPYGVPYPVFSFTGVLPWNLFAGSLARSGTSLVGSAN